MVLESFVGQEQIMTELEFFDSAEAKMKRKKWILFEIALLVSLAISCQQRESSIEQPTGQHVVSFQRKITKIITGQYLLFLPQDYYQDKRNWPLMLFLHGGGERSDDLQLVKRHGPPKIVETKKDFPFIVVSPQCPQYERWTAEYLTTLLDEVVSHYRVDEDRIYVTGLSMGGAGTWTIATATPERFAAIVPICPARSLPNKAQEIKDLPIWAFHGTKDNRVPIERTIEMVNALKKCGSNVRFTVYPEPRDPLHPHDCWTETYENPELYEWLLSHQRGGSK